MALVGSDASPGCNRRAGWNDGRGATGAQVGTMGGRGSGARSVHVGSRKGRVSCGGECVAVALLCVICVTILLSISSRSSVAVCGFGRMVALVRKLLKLGVRHERVARRVNEDLNFET